MGSSPPRRQEQTIQLELDLGVRGRGAGRHEVDDQPSKPPVRHPSPHLTELSEDAVPPLGVRRLPRSVGWWYGGAHEPEPMRLSTVAACQIGCPRVRGPPRLPRTGRPSSLAPPGPDDLNRGRNVANSRRNSSTRCLRSMRGANHRPRRVVEAGSWKSVSSPEVFSAGHGVEDLGLGKMEWDRSRIRALRAALRLTREEFAHQLGAAPKTVQNWEEGRHPPGFALMRALDEAWESATPEQNERFLGYLPPAERSQERRAVPMGEMGPAVSPGNLEHGAGVRATSPVFMRRWQTGPRGSGCGWRI